MNLKLNGNCLIVVEFQPKCYAEFFFFFFQFWIDFVAMTIAMYILHLPSPLPLASLALFSVGKFCIVKCIVEGFYNVSQGFLSFWSCLGDKSTSFVQTDQSHELV